MPLLEKIQKAKQSGSVLQREVRKQTIGYIAAALSLVAGLAWNDFVKSLIEYLFPLIQNTIFAKLLYAVLITLIVVFLTLNLTKLIVKDGESK